MNFFEHQQQARNKTKRLVIYFLMATIAIAFSVNFAVYLSVCISQIACQTFSYYWKQEWWLIVTLVTLAVILITSLIRWRQLNRQGGLKAVLMAGATSIDLNSQNLHEKRLINVVEEMSIASGMPVPQIFVMKNELGINAFVAGTEPHNAYLAVTRGCLEQLSRQELQGVIGHEFSHILNGDMRINLKLIGLLAGITVIGQLGMYLLNIRKRSRHSTRTDNNKRDRHQQNNFSVPFIGLAFVIVGYIGLFFARLIKSAISRQREFLADASAVQFTRNKEGITNALHKIEQHRFSSLLVARSTEELSHLCFGTSHQISFFSKLLATHPSSDDRIKRIEPNFKPSTLKTVEKAEKTAPSSTGQADTNESKVSPEQTFSNTLLMGQIGNLESKHIENAQRLLAQTHQKLLAIARGQDQQTSSECLIYGLLVLVNTLPTVEILSLATAWLPSEQMAGVKRVLKDLKSQSHEQQWTLIELAIPRIKQLSKIELDDFQRNIKRLVDCDKKVSLSEYLIFSIAKRWLDNSKSEEKTMNSYKNLSSELHYLLFTLLSTNSNSTEKNERLCRELLRSFGLAASQNHPTQFNANLFHRSLLKIARLNPLLKQPVIEAFVSCISSDNRVTKKEYLILRVFCEYLDCPLPAIM